MTKLETARVQLETAQSKLDAALVAGADTRELRRELSDAQAKLNRLLDADAVTDAPDPAIEASITYDAQALLDDAVTAIRVAVEQATTFDRPNVSLNANVAETVVRVRHQAARDADARRAHADKLTELQGRLRTLEQRRNDIVSERASGVIDDDRQGPALALIQADQDGLRQLIERHQADAPPVGQKGDAETQWQVHISQVQSVAMLKIAVALEARLIAVAEDLARLSGGRMDLRFQPSAAWIGPVARRLW